MSDTLPRDVFRNEVVYRRTAAGCEPGVTGCGFLLKPTRRGEVRDLVGDEYVAVYVLRGRGTYVDGRGRRHQLSAGCVAQRLPGRRHSTLLEPDGQWAECFLAVDARFFRALVTFTAADGERPVLRPGLRHSLVAQFDAILADLRQLPDPDLPQTLLSAHRLISELCARDRERQRPNLNADLVDAACTRLAEDLHARLPIADIFASLPVSYERLRKVFRQRVGIAPNEYRIRRRIEAACTLLVETSRSVSQIADALGYPDVYTFSRQFKQQAGLPPDAFRHRGISPALLTPRSSR